MKKILILGSSGQIGSSLVQVAKKNSLDIIEFDIARSRKEDLRILNNKGFLDYLSEIDFLFFLAFDVGGSRYLKEYQSTFDFISNNIKIMDNVFSVLKNSGTKFIFASSQMSNMTFSNYGLLKKIGEKYTETLNGLTVKFWNVYGIEKDLNKSHVITDFILMAKNNKEIRMITNGAEERQFLYSDDASEALLSIANNYEKIDRNKELHITNGEWTSVLEVAKIISENYANAPIIVGNEEDKIQNSVKNVEDKYIYKFWKPKTSLRDGIKKIINFYETR